MSLKMTSKGGTDFPRCPVGTTLGICYGVVDLGMQSSQMYGPKPAIMLLFETPNELMADGRPFGLNKEYGASMSPKSWLRKDIESWLGIQFETDAEAYDYDVMQLVGQPCLLGVTEKKAKGSDRIYTNITTISKLMKGMAVPAQSNPSVVYDMDNHDPVTYDKLPEWIRKKIDAGKSISQQSDYAYDDGAGYRGDEKTSAATAGAGSFEDDDLPF